MHITPRNDECIFCALVCLFYLKFPLSFLLLLPPSGRRGWVGERINSQTSGRAGMSDEDHASPEHMLKFRSTKQATRAESFHGPARNHKFIYFARAPLRVVPCALEGVWVFFWRFTQQWMNLEQGIFFTNVFTDLYLRCWSKLKLSDFSSFYIFLLK